MNIKQLHELTGDLIAKGHGLEEVAIAKESFTSPYEQEGGTILAVETGAIEIIDASPIEGPGSEDETPSPFLVLRGAD